MTSDGRLVALGRETVGTERGDFVVHRFHHTATGAHPLAIVRGDPGGAAPLPARVHSSCLTSEGLGARDCDCAEQLDGALAHLAAVGRGVLFYLQQEGRGAGFVAKALDRMLVQASGNRLTTFEAYAQLGLPPDQRRYDDVPAMVQLLGVEAPLRLLSNNPDKARALAACGTRLAGTAPLRIAPSPYSQHYLAAKARAGHAITAGRDVGSARLPSSVPVLDPTPVPGASHLTQVAAYLLPVASGGTTVWFRLTVYVDATGGAPRIVLRYGDGERVPVRIQRERLLDHFRPCVPRFRCGWDAAVARIVAHGSGIVLLAGEHEALSDAVVRPLVRAQLAGRSGHVLALAGDPPADAIQVERALAAAGH